MNMLYLPDFSRARILVAGDVMLDQAWQGDTKRISPEAPVPIVNIRKMTQAPGGAGNVSLNIAMLGGQVFLTGIVGCDTNAQLLKEKLQMHQIHADFVEDANIQTITKLRIVSHHQQLIRLDFEQAFDQPQQQALLATKIEHQLPNVDLVLFSDYAKGTLSEVQRYIQQARAFHKPILVDPKGTDFAKYQGATLVTPNMHEFTQVVGPCHNEQEIIEKGTRLLQAHHWQALLITRSEEGMTLIEKDCEPYHLPTHAKEVYDVTGAGDTVIATLATALAAGAPLKIATKLANIAAGIVVGKLGTASVTPLELHQAMKALHEATSSPSQATMMEMVREAQKAGQKIVFTNGCFDVLHAGHVQYLQEAKKLGDKLIVGINSDASVQKLKGPTRPINPLDARIKVLEALSAVDWVIPFEEETPKKLIETIAPDILVKGGDYQIENIVGADFVKQRGGTVKVLSFLNNYSTTNTIEKIKMSSME
jgi:D-beta-D-heptose 7-phosphate kinase / D-beta-D-heptose 1-phosphate adenosyltransferase